ncbi:MAG: transcriptional regulator [Lachnospiraceae bacterium]|nr:transcriptional regulator [Lachnospiraceae bacterium]
MSEEKNKNDNNNTIGKNIQKIRKIRKEKHIGQTELVRELQLINVNMTRETLVKIERVIQHIQLGQLKGIKAI